MFSAAHTGQGFQNVSAAQVRERLAGKSLDGLNLLDVRQPQEFDSGHIPGAQLIPVGELQQRLSEVDASKSTIVYCHSGMRGMAAAGILTGAGHSDVVNLNGGMMAWDGQSVGGLPDAGLAWFDTAAGIEGLLEQAWLIEEGARRFYERAAEVTDAKVADAFRALVASEEGHKDEVLKLYQRVVGSEPDFDWDAVPERIEGGPRLDDALAWIEKQDTRTIIEMAIALEATAYDRYTQLVRLSDDESHKTAFAAMAEGERKHLDEVIALFVPYV